MKEKIQMDIVQTAQKILTNSSYLDIGGRIAQAV